MAQKNKKTKTSTGRIIARNRRAHHEYDILETFEAGIVLSGCEVRSLRENNANLTDAFAIIRRGEAWLNNLHISPYSKGNIANREPNRRRKMLLHKRQIRYLHEKTHEAGLTLVPLSLYFNQDGLAKVELALARGKKLYDKRQSMREVEIRREIDRTMKSRH